MIDLASSSNQPFPGSGNLSAPPPAPPGIVPPFAARAVKKGRGTDDAADRVPNALHGHPASGCHENSKSCLPRLSRGGRCAGQNTADSGRAERPLRECRIAVTRLPNSRIMQPLTPLEPLYAAGRGQAERGRSFFDEAVEYSCRGLLQLLCRKNLSPALDIYGQNAIKSYCNSMERWQSGRTRRS